MSRLHCAAAAPARRSHARRLSCSAGRTLPRAPNHTSDVTWTKHDRSQIAPLSRRLHQTGLRPMGSLRAQVPIGPAEHLLLRACVASRQQPVASGASPCDSGIFHVPWHAETRLVRHEKGHTPCGTVHTAGPCIDASARAPFLSRVHFFVISHFQKRFFFFVLPSLRS